MKLIIFFLSLFVFSFSYGQGCFTYEQQPTVFDTVFTTQSVVVSYTKQFVTTYSVPAYTEQVLICKPNQMQICEKKHTAIKTTCEVLIPVYKSVEVMEIRVTPWLVKQVPCKE